MKRYRKFDIITNILVALLSLLVIIPIVTVLLGSLKTVNEAELVRFSLPAKPLWGNFAVAAKVGKLGRSFFNSMLIATVCCAVSLITASMAGFVMSRRKSRFNRALYIYFILGLIAPVNMVTVVQVMKSLGLLGTMSGYLLYYSASLLAFSVFMFYGYLASVPVSLDESAVLDGAGALRIYWQIILPLLKPILITLLFINFMNAWNEFIAPLYLVNNSRLWPMTLAVFNFIGMYRSEWNYIFADVILTCLPVVIVYLIGQKYIVKGMSAGAVKG
ncbi:MAG: carbohydrate ABC transporter permease [Spirochaetales bacterium]|nr:carbohydrate ABC transporter permease [Spirochaetales bacterium]